MIDKTFDFLFSKICPKPPNFLEETFIISSFLVRFQLIHMTDLLILHVTKAKHIQKLFHTIVQSYFFSIFFIFGKLFQIEMDIFQKE